MLRLHQLLGPWVEWANSSSLGEEASRRPLPPRWFARGWTLQELLAPAKVQFNYTTWRSKGFKQDRRIVPELSRVTGVSEWVQHDGSKNSLSRACLAQRMSWAAHRETSGVEDISYYLLGIFQVNMTLLYGEVGRFTVCSRSLSITPRTCPGSRGAQNL